MTRMNSSVDDYAEAQPWVKKWVSAEYEETPGNVSWVQTRPRSIQDLMIRFPPNCLVRTFPSKELVIPKPGTLGIVVSYREDGGVTVMQHPDAEIRAVCDPSWLEVVGYFRGITPEAIRKMIGRKDT